MFSTRLTSLLVFFDKSFSHSNYINKFFLRFLNPAKILFFNKNFTSCKIFFERLIF